MRSHDLRVQQPYFDALDDGSKTFEVRRNDRAFQRGDLLHLWEFEQGKVCFATHTDPARFADCPNYSGKVINRYVTYDYSGKVINRYVTYVYSGDPRFGGVEAGHVVLALGDHL